jgi:hypothetical protein
MTKKELIQQLAILKNDKKVIELEIQVIQNQLLDDRDWDYDLDWVRVYEKTNVRYTFNKDYAEQFKKEYPELVTEKYLTKDLSKEEKRKYFKKWVSKPFLMFE